MIWEREKKDFQRLKERKKKKIKKKIKIWELLGIDMLEWLNLTGKLSKASSKLLMYFRHHDSKFYMEIVRFFKSPRL